jgi:hypothetical protein
MKIKDKQVTSNLLRVFIRIPKKNKEFMAKHGFTKFTYKGWVTMEKAGQIIGFIGELK